MCMYMCTRAHLKVYTCSTEPCICWTGDAWISRFRNPELDRKCTTFSLQRSPVQRDGPAKRARTPLVLDILTPNPDGVLDSANCWHYRSVSLGEAFGGSLTTDSAKKLALFRCKSGYRDFLCMLRLVVSKGRYEWAVRNIEEKTYFLGKIHYYFIFYSLALVLALHTYGCHPIKQSQKSYALKNFHLLRLRNNYINHKKLKWNYSLWIMYFWC